MQPKPSMSCLPPPHANCPARLRVLLVEDEPADAELTREAIASLRIPFACDHLRRGSEVAPYLIREQAEGNLPDLILLDLGLPSQDGFELLADLSAMRGAIRGIPIVILTGYAHFDYLKKTDGLCIADYLTKPCDSARLRHILARLVN